MKIIYQCMDCDTEYTLEDLKIIKGTTDLFLQCTNEECLGDCFVILLK